MKPDVIIQLTTSRVELSKIAAIVAVVDDESYEQVNASIKLAGMWMGKSLGYLGATNPYPTSMDSKNPTIEQSADVADFSEKQAIEYINSFETETAFVKELRKQLDAIAKQLESNTQALESERLFQAANLNAWTHTQNAKMFLGLVLGRIRDHEKVAGRSDESLPPAPPTKDTPPNETVPPVDDKVLPQPPTESVVAPPASQSTLPPTTGDNLLEF